MRKKRIALVGNPNVGKSSLFNLLTGLRQKTGNYPGITVEKKIGFLKHKNNEYEITDLPGSYGLYPSSLDEEIVLKTLMNPNNEYYPDLAVVVGIPQNLKRSITLYQKVREIGVPAVFVINMIDELGKSNSTIDFDKLEDYLQTKVIQTNARTGKGIEQLKEALEYQPKEFNDSSFDIPKEFQNAVNEIKTEFNIDKNYLAWQHLSQNKIESIAEDKDSKIKEIRKKYNIIPRRLQVKETLDRNAKLDEDLEEIIIKNSSAKKRLTEKIDAFLIHPFWGYVIFFALMLIIFQAVYAWAEPMMSLIEESFGSMASYVGSLLPEGPINSLLTDGVINGIGGIVVFIPQIVILFIFISLMEESGYMSRVVFLMDRWLKPFGLSGKSVVPLMSGVACAVPAIMSARNIENDKERLITMLVTPFMTCSARLPIYVILIALVIPEGYFLGLGYQGLTLLIMYVLGILAALGGAWVLKFILKTEYKSFLILEMPSYKIPALKNLLHTVWEKSSGFIIDAGKIIFALSIILWVLGNFGFGENYNNAEKIIMEQSPHLQGEELEAAIYAHELEHSMLGYLGRKIEPLVEPLGYDWKMGIGLISSFAAREVFVGTMATIYSLGETDDELTIRQRMAAEINKNTGKPAYNLASGISLLLFYAFAMQCMSTVAIMKKETDSWKWTLFQAISMTLVAYILAFIAYQFLK